MSTVPKTAGTTAGGAWFGVRADAAPAWLPTAAFRTDVSAPCWADAFRPRAPTPARARPTATTARGETTIGSTPFDRPRERPWDRRDAAASPFRSRTPARLARRGGDPGPTAWGGILPR